MLSGGFLRLTCRACALLCLRAATPSPPPYAMKHPVKQAEKFVCKHHVHDVQMQNESDGLFLLQRRRGEDRNNAISSYFHSGMSTGACMYVYITKIACILQHF